MSFLIKARALNFLVLLRLWYVDGISIKLLEGYTLPPYLFKICVRQFLADVMLYRHVSSSSLNLLFLRFLYTDPLDLITLPVNGLT